jgi:hypothetical protein
MKSFSRIKMGFRQQKENILEELLQVNEIEHYQAQ